MSDDSNEIECQDCGTVPTLVETPYRDESGYVVECNCGSRGIDVTDAVNGSALVEPITGKWSNINHNTRIGSGDPT